MPISGVLSEWVSAVKVINVSYFEFFFAVDAYGNRIILYV